MWWGLDCDRVMVGVYGLIVFGILVVVLDLVCGIFLYFNDCWLINDCCLGCDIFEVYFGYMDVICYGKLVWGSELGFKW